MRKLIFVLLIACVAFVGCQAKEAEARGGGDPCKSFLGSVLNDCIPEAVKEKDTWIYGVGVDVPLWKNDKVIIDQETKLDLNDGVNLDGVSTYTVVKPQMERGLFQIVGDFFSNLFNRE
jgi:hypothetical protein